MDEIICSVQMGLLLWLGHQPLICGPFSFTDMGLSKTYS